jgi:sulfate permease, SulP family
VKLPGFLHRLRPYTKTARPDAIAGVVLGVESVPDALASGVLAGVNPLYALYAVMLGTPVGAIFSGSVYLSVQTTSAMALVVASVAVVTSGSPGTLFALSLITGVIMLVAGFLKAGRLLRWVANSEMVGFMTGVAFLIILGQLGDLTGYASEYSNKVVKAIDLLLNLDKVDLPTVTVGIGTIILILVLQKTRLRGFGLVVAIIVASILPALFGWDSVARVSDIAEITGGLPLPALPDFSHFFELIVPALSLAVIGLIQGAGVSQAFVNPDGRYPNPSRDFIGEGAANVAAGLFQGMPVGGSASATSLVVSSGARSRLANIFAGVVIAIITLLFAGAVGKLALPALAGLLIVIGFGIIKPANIRGVWRTGNIQRIIMVITFALVLTIPLQYAVLAGVALSILLFTVRQSNRIAVVAWTLKEGKLPIEGPPPTTIPPRSVTVLVPYGSLFYAAATSFEEKLPQPDAQTSHAVVIINLHGRADLGSTLMRTIDRYVEDLKNHDSRLMLAEVDPALREQLARAGIVDSISRRSIFLQTEEVAGSLYEAYAAAQEWVSQEWTPQRGTPEDGPPVVEA